MIRIFIPPKETYYYGGGGGGVLINRDEDVEIKTKSMRVVAMLSIAI